MKKCKSILFTMIMAIFCSMIVVQPIFAAELSAVPVTISLSGTLPETKEEFSVYLKADNAAFPMPSGSKDGMYVLKIAGAGSKNIPQITYDTVGVYTYTIYQEAGKNEACTYDDMVYTLKVTITNKEDYSGLESTVVLHPYKGDEKLTDVEFKNEYKTEEPPTPPIGGTDESGPTEPSTPPVDNSGVQTGDQTDFVFYIVLLAGSLSLMIFLCVTAKKKHTEE